MLKTGVMVSMLAVVVFGLAGVAGAPNMKLIKVLLKPNVETAHMGGVAVPSAEALKSMHDGQYILRAVGSHLTKMPVVKTLLPHCPKIGVQGVQVDLGTGDAMYSRQSTILCKSTDGG